MMQAAVRAPSRRSQRAARHIVWLLAQALPGDELERFAQRLDELEHDTTTTLPAEDETRAALAERLAGGYAYMPAERAELEAWALLARATDRRALLAGALKTGQVAELLGRSRQAVHDRAAEGALLAINDSGEHRYPAWQFDPSAKRGVVPGLPDVLATLAVDPLSKARWLTRPNAVLEGRSPLDALKNGEQERVIAEARGVGGDV